MSNTDWVQSTNQELEQAFEARINGNEGRARVCARRAAGHIAGEYLNRQNINIGSDSALTRLRYLAAVPQVTPKAKEFLEHFLIHTTPEHELPINADLIADVYLLAQELLAEPLD